MSTRTSFAVWTLALAPMLVGCPSDTAITEPKRSALELESSLASQRFSAWSDPVNLGPTINSPFREFGPTISKDGLSLYFSSNRPGGFGANDLWVSRRASLDAAWGTPKNLGPIINSGFIEAAPNISRDGHLLFFASNRPGGSGSNDIWVSRRVDTRDDFAWEEPVNLSPEVNSPAFDAGPHLRRPELYLASNRATGTPLVGLDIYVSRLGPGGTFDRVVPVVELNSDQADARPSVRFDGLEIFLGSNRLGSLDGSLDIWVSTRKSNAAPWSPPINLGERINTESLELQPAVSGDGKTLFFASDRPGGSGGLDLYVASRVLEPW